MSKSFHGYENKKSLILPSKNAAMFNSKGKRKRWEEKNMNETMRRPSPHLSNLNGSASLVLFDREAIYEFKRKVFWGHFFGVGFSILNVDLGFFPWQIGSFWSLLVWDKKRNQLECWLHPMYGNIKTTTKKKKKNYMHNLRPVAWIIIKLCNFLLRKWAEFKSNLAPKIPLGG